MTVNAARDNLGKTKGTVMLEFGIVAYIAIVLGCAYLLGRPHDPPGFA